MSDKPVRTTIRQLAEQFADKWNTDKSSITFPGNRDAFVFELELLMAEYAVSHVDELRSKGLAL